MKLEYNISRCLDSDVSNRPDALDVLHAVHLCLFTEYKKEGRNNECNQMVREDVESGRIKWVQGLMFMGANIHATYLHNKNLLNIVCKGDDVMMARYLIKLGVSINAKDTYGYTALHRSCRPPKTILFIPTNSGRTNPELVRLLLSSGANVNARDGEGKTALYYAVYYNRDPLVTMLIEQPGCDVNIPDNKGWTPLDLAIYYDFHLITELLGAKGGVVSKSKGPRSQNCI